MTSTLYRDIIERAVLNHGLEANLLEALVIMESAGRAWAYRYEPGYYARYLAGKAKWRGQIPERIAASYGLCQLMYPTALEHNFPYADPEFLFVPSINLEFGCRVLGKLMDWARGDVLRALAAYNGGIGGFKLPAAQAYAAKVNAKLEEIQAVRRR